MRDIIPDIDRWFDQQEDIALATVIQTWGSSPRGVGSRMAITGSGQISGSVSGGCVEGAVVEAASEVLKSKHAQLLHFGVADETAWEVGLACGGSIDVFVAPVNLTLYQQIHTSLQEGQPISILTIVSGPEELVGQEALLRDQENAWSFSTLDGSLKVAGLVAARAALDSGQSYRIPLARNDTDETVEAYIDVLLPPPVLIAVGGAHISIALVSIAHTLGYHTVVVDPRKAFGSAERFPHADELIQLWPDKALRQVGLTRSTAVAVLTHDPKLDDPALIVALPSRAFYVGALGSRTTQAKRRQRLLDAGLTEEALNRLYGPIGLEIGARTPEEIALAIMAEIVAARDHVLKGVSYDVHPIKM
jgi:xanthine dehydrogenase accessory factor